MYQCPFPDLSMFSAVFMLIFLFAGLFGLLATAFWIWMIVDCIQNEPKDGNDRIVWILILIFTGVLGGLLYLFIR
ncbi:MAG: PLDc N-terminal domain-containing protein, partial [Armatimonadota bacterium]